MKPGLAKTLAVVLLAVVLLLVNFLVARLPLRGDLTEGKIYTLSPGTRSLLQKLEEPVALTLYASRGVAGLPTREKNYADRVEDMLRAYVRAAGGRLTLEVVNAAADTPEEERAQTAGLQPQQVRGTGEPFYLGLVATLADQQKVIPVFGSDREEFLEYDLSTLIYSVQQINKPKLGLLTRLPLAGQPFNMMNPRPSRSQLIHDEWAKSFQIVSVEPGFTTLPADLAALAVLHPTGLTPEQEFAIDQFLLSGKPVLLAVDPSSTWFKRQGGQMGMFGGSPDASSDLPRLLKAYGVKYDAQQVVGDQRIGTPINTRSGRVAAMPVWLSLTAANLNASSPATAQLSSLLFIEPGSFDIEPREGREIVLLAQTTDTAGTVPAFTLGMAEPDDVNRTLIKGTTKKTLAALVRGPLKTAFPDGKPAAAPADPAKPAEPAPAPAADVRKEGNATLLVVGDTDWLLDDFSVRRIPAFGQELMQPLNDNLAFGANALEFLAGSSDLIGLRGKQATQRPFEVVDRMRADAEARYNSKLMELESSLTQLQSKISELQGKTPEGGRLVATPEVLREIEKFQAEEIAKRRERNAIRRAFTQDIDALETRLIIINALATPCALLVFGLWFVRHRKHAVSA